MKASKRCSQCGGKMNRRGFDLGYSARSELGRSAGAKGRDEFAVLELCDNCDSADWELVPDPCWVCGSEPTQEVDGWARIKETTGLSVDCPEIPSRFNLCGSSECSDMANQEIYRLVDEAMEQGGFEE